MHSGKIPNFKNSHGENFQTRCAAEPPACVQNAMLTKDKKPFTYTPGGLDLSQIKTPSMARRMNKQQRSLEEDEHPYQNGCYNGGGGHIAPIQPSCGPPAPPPPPPVAPPPPPLIIKAPPSRSPKPPEGERPEIIIPENPIGMLRKTNSPYHWETEMADRQREGLIPKFVEKSATPSPIQPHLISEPPPQYMQNSSKPQQFSQEPPQSYHYTQQQQQSPINKLSQHSPQSNNFTPSSQYQYSNQSPQPQNSIQYSPQPYYQQFPQPTYLQKQTSQQSPQQVSPASQNNYQVYSPVSQNSTTEESPIWKPEPKYPSPYQSASITPRSPLSQVNDLKSVTSTPTRDILQRQDSQFNKSPAPYSSLSGNASPYQQISPLAPSQSSISPNSSSSTTSSPWRQSVATNSPSNQETFSSPFKDNRISPAVSSFRNSPAVQEISISPANNIPQQLQNKYGSNYKEPQPEQPPQYIYNNIVQPEPSLQNGQPQIQNYSNVAPWRNPQHIRQEPNGASENRSNPEEIRFQSHMTIPVVPRKQINPESQPIKSPQKEVVFVTQEPVYYKPLDSPKEVPPWVKAKSEKEKTPPPVWCTRPLENRKSIPRDVVSQDKEPIVQPPWVQKSPELQRRSFHQEQTPLQQNIQNVPWSQKPSENRKSLPRDIPAQTKINMTNRNLSEREDSQVRIIPIKMEVSSKEIHRNAPHDSNRSQHGKQNENYNPNQLRIIINMKNEPTGTDQQQYAQPKYDNTQYNQSSYNQPQHNQAQFSQPQYHPPQNIYTQYGDTQYNQPQQRISRVSNPQMVILDNTFGQQQGSQPKTRIIPIQIEQSPGTSAPKSGIIGSRN